ncbi:MAG: dicarboxylate/amino acid:cation symporter [Gemmataceae bacterium]|nr:dicarboxylate/amino acid:cation symporter [Gemmataceae bacterium]
MHHPASPAPPPPPPDDWLGRALHAYGRVPLVAKILVALVLGIAAGYALGKGAAALEPMYKIILRLLGALATPLIFLAVVNALVKTEVRGAMAGRMLWLLMLNTVVAILVGITVANLMRPGVGAGLAAPADEEAPTDRRPYNLVDDLLGKLPSSVVKPFAENDILGVIFLALAAGIALRVVRGQLLAEGSASHRAVEDLLDVSLRVVMVVLHWVIAVVPLAVFAVVAGLVGAKGIAGFQSMLWFVLAVLIALGIQACYYLVRLAIWSRFHPWVFLRGAGDALMLAFSTASSAATMPVSYACARDKLGVREEAAGLGVFVGGTFNHDGTALYEAMAALFISQVIGRQLGFSEQVLVVIMSVVASVGAAGIPEAGLVTMLAVFKSVGLPIEYIPLLLTVDWFLDRCRTAINVMGDLAVTCMLDGPEAGGSAPGSVEQPARTNGDPPG